MQYTSESIFDLIAANQASVAGAATSLPVPPSAAPDPTQVPDTPMRDPISTIASELQQREQEHAALATVCEQAVAAELVTERGVRVLVTPSAQRSDTWQATRFDDHGPVGHSEHSSLHAAIGAYRGVRDATGAPIAEDSRIVSIVDAVAATATIPEVRTMQEAAPPPPPPAAATPLPSVAGAPGEVACISAATTRAFTRRVQAGEVSVAEIQRQYAVFSAAIPQIRAELKAKTLDQLAPNRRSGATKDEIITHYIHRLQEGFLPGGVNGWMPMTESWETAVSRQVAALTPEGIAEVVRERQSEAAERERVLTQPDSLSDFRRFLLLHPAGEAGMSDAQLARFDQLHAEDMRAIAARRAAARREQCVQQASAVVAGLGMTTVAGYHTKHQKPMWTVRIGQRVDADAFSTLRAAAKAHGGSWSSYGARDQHGFIFFAEDAAARFVASQAPVTATPGNPVPDSLRAVATRKLDAANEALDADRKVNTVRRASIANSIEKRARQEIARAQTAMAIADAVERGRAPTLARMTHWTHLEALEAVAQWAKSASAASRHEPWEETRDREVGLADVRHLAYPHPNLTASHLATLAAQRATVPGGKQASHRLLKLAHAAMSKTGKDPRVHLSSADQIADLRTVLSLDTSSESCLQDQLALLERVRTLGCDDLQVLRHTLRAYLEHRVVPGAADAVVERERDLLGRSVGVDFFPSPRGVVDALIDTADLAPGMSILEPSAGKGDIVDGIVRRFPQASLDITAVELSGALVDILRLKGQAAHVHHADFLTWEPGRTYDRIVANVPFGDEIAHVQRAASLLAPGGRLSSVMSESPFIRDDSASRAFRGWMEDRGARSLPLPDGSFASDDAFRRTSVRTRILIVDAPRI